MRMFKWLGLTVIFMVWVPKARLDMDKQSQFSLEIALCGEALARNVPENAHSLARFKRSTLSLM